MNVRSPRRSIFWLAALSLVLGTVSAPVAARGQSSPKRSPAGRTPSNSPALRGASPRSNPGALGSSNPSLYPSRIGSVQLPFNMVWGDSQQRLSALFAGVGAKVTDKKTKGQTETWTVEGLIASDLQSSIFTFTGGFLAAIEFDYGQPDWDLPKFNDKMGLFRRVLESKCGGPGTMTSRDTKEEPGSTVKESLMGYQWDRGDTTVQLFYFSAEDTAKGLTFRTISVHYHYKDMMQQQEQYAMPEAGGGPVDPNSNPLFGGQRASAPVAAPGSTVAPTRGKSGRHQPPGATPEPTAIAIPDPETPAASPAAAPDAQPMPSPTATPDVQATPSPAATPEAQPVPAPEEVPDTQPTPSPAPSAGKTPTPASKAKPSPKSPENDPLPEN